MAVKPRRYAEGTEVSAQKSREELETLLEKHGATQIQVSRDSVARQAVVVFKMSDRNVRFDLKVDMSDVPQVKQETWNTKDDRLVFPRAWGPMSYAKRAEYIASTLSQREREAWRRLLLITKGKLELIADAQSTVEREFLADILLPDGQTVYGALRQGLATAYSTGNMPLLPGHVSE